MYNTSNNALCTTCLTPWLICLHVCALFFCLVVSRRLCPSVCCSCLLERRTFWAGSLTFNLMNYHKDGLCYCEIIFWFVYCHIYIDRWEWELPGFSPVAFYGTDAFWDSVQSFYHGVKYLLKTKIRSGPPIRKFSVFFYRGDWGFWSAGATGPVLMCYISFFLIFFSAKT